MYTECTLISFQRSFLKTSKSNKFSDAKKLVECYHCDRTYIKEALRCLSLATCDPVGELYLYRISVCRQQLPLCRQRLSVCVDNSSCNCPFSPSNFSILRSCRSEFDLSYCEALYIKKYNPSLNCTISNHGSSIFLKLFQCTSTCICSCVFHVILITRIARNSNIFLHPNVAQDQYVAYDYIINTVIVT